MKKLLIAGILALSAASFANTHDTKGHDMANMPAGQHTMKDDKMGSMKVDGKCCAMMSHEMTEEQATQKENTIKKN